MPAETAIERPPKTVLGILQWTAGFFKRHGLENPRADAEILLAHALDCRRIDLYLRHDQPLNEGELARFKPLIQRRSRREPVAYIVGVKEFWSLDFAVTPAVLIPRPDTECLVETALKYLPGDNPETPQRVLELGVGSGAVTVSLAYERPGDLFWASDRSLRAVLIARTNARRHGVHRSVRFFVGHWLSALASARANFDMILSNPPYVARRDIAALAPEIRNFEPVAALDGGPDGLADIGAIIAAAPAFLRPGGRLLLEIGYDQRDAVEQMSHAAGAYREIDFYKDYAGHLRVVRLQKKSP